MAYDRLDSENAYQYEMTARLNKAQKAFLCEEARKRLTGESLRTTLRWILGQSCNHGKAMQLAKRWEVELPENNAK